MNAFDLYSGHYDINCSFESLGRRLIMKPLHPEAPVCAATWMSGVGSFVYLRNDWVRVERVRYEMVSVRRNAGRAFVLVSAKTFGDVDQCHEDMAMFRLKYSQI